MNQEPARKFSVLIVDDEPFNREYLKQELDEYQFDILVAEDGKQALDKFQLFKPDLILLDLMMPVVDGFDVLKNLRSYINKRETEVIIISALGDTSSISKGLELGAEDYLSKPFNPIILHARIKSIIEKHKLHQIEKKYLASLEREMEIGREIQADFLPSEIPQPEGWSLAVKFLPARNVAGDYYDIFHLSEDLLAVISGDVCDKGIGAALYMSLYRSLIRAFALSEYSKIFENDIASSTLAKSVIHNTLHAANAYICATHKEALFSSIFFGLLQTQTGELLYANAGHEPPKLIRDSGEQLSIKPTGPVLGFDSAAEFGVASLQLADGDFLLICSDGVLDARDADGNEFRDTACLDQIIPSLGSSMKILDDIMHALDAFTEGNPQFDDITIIGLKRISDLMK